jgi:hypothetical protein
MVRKPSQACWYMSVIPALGGLRQEDHEFKGTLVYIIRSCVKKLKTKNHKKMCLTIEKAYLHLF